MGFLFGAVVNGADGVNYVFAGEVVGGSELGGAGGTAVQLAAFIQERRAGSGVDGAVLGGKLALVLCSAESRLAYNTTSS